MLGVLSLDAQTWNNLHTKTIVVADSIKLDSFSIVPGSLMVHDSKNRFIPDSLYSIDYAKSKLVFNRSYLKSDTLYLVYRVFPIDFSADYPKSQLKMGTSQKAISELLTNESYAEPEPSKSLIEANGVIARGIGVGNNQNLTMNSSMNLQLKGKLDNDLMLEAYLSDKNLPIQADGYSQQIQAFDQIYIKVYDSLRMLQMGDLVLSPMAGYFMRFNRKLQGAKASIIIPKNEKEFTDRVFAGAAIAKGTYNRQTFNAIEGVQGPYQLKGANNEAYIVVLAGTEKVYLDGALLERGEKADYVMDYNTAEITFTPKNLLTANSRIITEFEYSDRNYNRYSLYAQNEIESKKATYNIAFYSESDARNQPVDQDLTDRQKEILANASDAMSTAAVPNFDSVAFNINLVLYKLVDTTVNNIRYDSIFVQSYHADSAFYQVGFVNVGTGLGDYVLTKSSANGKVYKWIAPENGIHQGSYLPVKVLVAPYKKQMLTASAVYRINQRTRMEMEAAFSNYDKNTFSSIGNADNNGFAGMAKLAHAITIQNVKAGLTLEGQMVSKDFTAIERFRETEFERRWGLNSEVAANEYLGGFGIDLSNKEKSFLQTESQYLVIGDFYRGLRNSFTSDFELRKWKMKANAGLQTNKNNNVKGHFYQYCFDISHPVKTVHVGIKREMEDRWVGISRLDSASSESRKFYKTTTYLRSADTSKIQTGLSYSNLAEFLPLDNRFKAVSQSHDISATSVVMTNENNRLDATVTWRKIEILSFGQIKGMQPDNLMTAQLNHQWRTKKGWLSFNSFYENATALENRKEFIYMEVATGKGIYIWNDYNQNGVPELDEFEISAFPEEANYIRVYTPTNDYMRVYSAKWNETVRLNPASVWKGKKGFQGFLSRFGDDITYRTTVKHTRNNLWDKVKPVKTGLIDSTLQNWSQNLRNTFSFNRNNPLFAMDWVYSQNGQKILLANGFDQSRQKANQLKLRWNISSQWMVTNDASINKKEYQSEYFISKNYKVNGVENQLTLQWQPTAKIRLSADYTPTEKKNTIGTEISTMHQLGADVKYSMPSQGLMSLRFEFVKIHYNGITSNSLTYEMLDGNEPGRNYRVMLHFQQTIGKYLELSVDYFGRKPESSSIIHTGQVSLSAVF